MDINLTKRNTGTAIVNAKSVDKAVNAAAQLLVTSLDTIAEVPADFDRTEEGSSRGVFHTETGRRLYDIKVVDEGTNGVYAVEIKPTNREALEYLRQIKH